MYLHVNLPHSTGSRASKKDLLMVQLKLWFILRVQTRAIPQNSILQQLGMMACSLGGIGMFLRKTPKQFS